jgi:hypothetical protein
MSFAALEFAYLRRKLRPITTCARSTVLDVNLYRLLKLGKLEKLFELFLKCRLDLNQPSISIVIVLTNVKLHGEK